MVHIRETFVRPQFVLSKRARHHACQIRGGRAHTRGVGGVDLNVLAVGPGLDFKEFILSHEFSGMEMNFLLLGPVRPHADRPTR